MPLYEVNEKLIRTKVIYLSLINQFSFKNSSEDLYTNKRRKISQIITSVKVYVPNIDFLCLKLNQDILRAKNDILKSRRIQFQNFKTLRFYM